MPPESAVFPGDDHPLCAHYAAIEEQPDRDEILSIGTTYPEPPPWDPAAQGSWRIRGMATREHSRDMGLGGRVLEALMEHARTNGGVLVWCNARVGALGFYRRSGFESHGEVFDDGIALHQSMWRTLDPRRSYRRPPRGSL